MKVLYWIIGIVVAIPIAILAVTYGASELGGEVVTLERAEPDGSTSQIRLWIVDQGEGTWIEHGDRDSFWMTRLRADSDITVTRNGEAITYRGTADPASHELYHSLRSEKYSWAEDVISIFGAGSEACTGIPVRLNSTQPLQ